MKLRKPYSSDFTIGATYGVGTEIYLVEPLNEAKTVWIAEVRCEDGSLVGGAYFDTLIVDIADVEEEIK